MPDLPPPPDITERSTASNSFTNIPVSEGGGVYPFNKVRKTLSGHQYEEDNTWGRERIKTTHCSGTSQEYCADGSMCTVVTGNDFKVVVHDETVIINGNVNLVVHGECNITAHKDLNITANKDMNVEVKGSRRTRIDGNDYLEVTGEIDMSTGHPEKGGGNYKAIINGESDIHVKGELRHTVDKKVKCDYRDECETSIAKDNIIMTPRKTIIDAGEVDIRGVGNLSPLEGEEYLEEFKKAGLGAMEETPGISLSSGNDIMISGKPDGMIYIPYSKLLMDHRGIEIRGMSAEKAGIKVCRGDITSELGDIFVNNGLMQTKKLIAEGGDITRATVGDLGAQKITCTGDITSYTDVIAGIGLGVSLKDHLHEGVRSGVDLTDEPVPMTPVLVLV